MTSALSEARPLRRRASAPRRALALLRENAEFSDALVFLYALVFIRQYLWVVSDNALAWTLAAPLSAVAWYFYVRTKPFAAARAGREFWLVVALPLLFVYMWRAPFPDVSFDVLNYRLLHAERSLRGTLFAPGDFFPTPAPYNPAPDTLTGLFRLALGYRLGTIVNLLSLVWAAQVVDKILRPFVARAYLRSACVLLVVLSEHLLFEINNYMVDLLALPLLLEATYIALRACDAADTRTDDAHAVKADTQTDETDATTNQTDARAREVNTHSNGGSLSLYVHAALLLGASAALKLTNATAIAPLVVVFAYTALAGPRRLAPKRLVSTLALSSVAFVAPILPFSVYLWRLTGNPFFPLANGFFKSPYWPTGGGWDARWGPNGAWETLVWPVLSTFEPSRHSELAVYSGRLSIAFVVALAGLAFVWRDRRARLLAFIFLAGCLLWSAGGMGYSRYGLYLELLAGIVVVAFAAALLKDARRTTTTRSRWRTALAYAFVAALVAQASLACVYAYRYEWSMRGTITHWRAYRSEFKYLLRDRTLARFLTDEERERYAGVGLWVESDIKSSGVEALLNPRAPVVTVSHQEFFGTREARRRFVQTIEANEGARMYSLCLPEDLQSAEEFMRSRGLTVGPATPVEVPFFSPSNRIGMMLVAVSPPRDAEARAAFESSWTKAALADEDYRAEITTADAPAVMRVGERTTLRLRVRNVGGAVWPARGDARGMYQVNAGDRWLDAAGSRVVNDLDGRAAMPADLQPGGEIELPLDVTAPLAPGEYVLEVDMIHEGVTFFYEKGSPTLRTRVRVEP